MGRPSVDGRPVCVLGRGGDGFERPGEMRELLHLGLRAVVPDVRAHLVLPALVVLEQELRIADPDDLEVHVDVHPQRIERLIGAHFVGADDLLPSGRTS